MSPDLEDRIGLGPDDLAALHALVAEHATLEDVLRWGERQTPPVAPSAIVPQDEYTHDVVVPVPEALLAAGPGDVRRFLVYDTT